MGLLEASAVFDEFAGMDKRRVELAFDLGKSVVKKGQFTHSFPVFLASVAGTPIKERVHDTSVRKLTDEIWPLCRSNLGEPVLVASERSPIAIGRSSLLVTDDPQSQLRFAAREGGSSALYWEVMVGIHAAYVNGRETGGRDTVNTRLPGVEAVKVGHVGAHYYPKSHGANISANATSESVYVGIDAISKAMSRPEIAQFVLEAAIL